CRRSLRLRRSLLSAPRRSVTTKSEDFGSSLLMVARLGNGAATTRTVGRVMSCARTTPCRSIPHGARITNASAAFLDFGETDRRHFPGTTVVLSVRSRRYAISASLQGRNGGKFKLLYASFESTL